MHQPSRENSFLDSYCQLLKNNFEYLFKEPFPIGLSDTSLGESIYGSRYIVVSHNNAQVPVFNYANLAAQKLWELHWDEFTTMPSYKSAQEDSQEDRAKLLARVQRDGYSRSYSGIRASSSGKRFEIKNVFVWNLYDDSIYKGQAALFNEWEFLD